MLHSMPFNSIYTGCDQHERWCYSLCETKTWCTLARLIQHDYYHFALYRSLGELFSKYSLRVFSVWSALCFATFAVDIIWCGCKLNSICFATIYTAGL